MTLPADHYRTLKRDLSLAELLADGIVHALALLAGLIAFPLLLFHGLQTAGAGTFVALTVYAAGFFLMWGFSLAYNMTPPSANYSWNGVPSLTVRQSAIAKRVCDRNEIHVEEFAQKRLTRATCARRKK